MAPSWALNALHDIAGPFTARSRRRTAERTFGSDATRRFGSVRSVFELVLTTSREPLALRDEHQVGLSSLKSTGRGDPAVELFITRARQARSEFRVDDESEGDVVEICRQLDGIPLAIELAATRTRSLSPAEIRERLSDRFRLLSAGRRRGLGRGRAITDRSSAKT